MTEVAAAPGRGEPEVTKLPLMRRAMVRHSIAAGEVPVFYLRTTADVTELVAARAALKDAAGGGRVPTINDAVVRAVALALRAHPDVNSAYVDGEMENYPRVNVGIAVAVPRGLVVPAIYDADIKDVHQISEDVRAAADLANRRKLTRELLEDSTFTVSNLGMFGIEEFDPLINTPQAAILGVGSSIEGADGRLAMRLTLGCDHRALTGAEGAPFLATIKDQLQRGADLLGPVPAVGVDAPA